MKNPQLSGLKPRPNAALSSFAAMAVLGIIWGATIPMIKVAVDAGFQPVGMIFWQLVIAVVLLGAVMVVRGYRLKFSRKYAFYFLIIGLIGTLLPNFFSYLAYQHLSAGIMGIIIATVPMCTMVIALVLRNEKFRWLRMTGVLLGIAAMILLALPETSAPDPKKVIFLLVAMIAPVCYGLEANYISMRAPKEINAVAVLFAASLIGLVITAPVVYFSGQWIDMFVPWGNAEWSLVGASVFHALAYTGYMWLVVRAGAVFSSQIGYVVTMAALLLSIAFLGETYSWFVWMALVIMLAGLALVQPKKAE